MDLLSRKKFNHPHNFCESTFIESEFECNQNEQKSNEIEIIWKKIQIITEQKSFVCFGRAYFIILADFIFVSNIRAVEAGDFSLSLILLYIVMAFTWSFSMLYLICLYGIQSNKYII